MGRICGVNRVFPYASVVFALMCFCGCAVMGSKYQAGEPFQTDQIRGIQPGKTTKQEILQWFGPPIAIARKGQVMNIPSPALHKRGSEEVQSETFFELFSTKHELTEDHVVYYYYYTEARGRGIGFFAFILFEASKTRLAVDKLWILINEKTGIVEDHVYREQK